MEQDRGTAEGEGAPRVLIVSDHASARFGGEAILPLHVFRGLRRRGVDAWLLVHERTRDELLALMPEEEGRIVFLPDGPLDRACSRLSRHLPSQLAHVTFGFVSRLSTQLTARRVARRLVAELGIDLVHQPIPVSPREPSTLYGLGAPVVIGPMNGNMAFPPAFQPRDERLAGLLYDLARRTSPLLHHLMPGKRRAAVLLVANERTRRGLPRGGSAEVLTLVENGVDLDLWRVADRPGHGDRPARFVFLGRLIALKAVDLLLEALARVAVEPAPVLEIIGDGPMRQPLEARAAALGLGDRVRFHGWQPQPESARRLREADALVLPSLRECGGAVVLEAMACGLPVVATRWGGPADYLDDSCGILVPPDSRESFVAGLAEAISRLAADPALAARLGRAGRERVERLFDWEAKTDQILEVYRRVLSRRTDPAPAVRR